MIINKHGEAFEYEGTIYRIGDQIVGNEQSEYSGLFGTITEIRDGKDKDTENETPDIYCSFEPPVLPYDVKELEKVFSDLYDEPKSIDDIILDMVIMAPEMIESVKSIEEHQRKIQVYLVKLDWANNNESGCSIIPFIDYWDAKRRLCQELLEEKQKGCISDWEESDDFVCESGSYFYECWLEGRYGEKHYKIALCQDTLIMSEKTFGLVGRAYIDESRMEDFEKQVYQWEDCGKLSEEQYKKFIKDPSIPERIHKKLSMNDLYWESYWESVSEVGSNLLNEYLKQNAHMEGEGGLE